MYQKPRFQRFGTFRELTRYGLNGASDSIVVLGIGSSPGCTSDLSEYGYGTVSYECPTSS